MNPIELMIVGAAIELLEHPHILRQTEVRAAWWVVRYYRALDRYYRVQNV